MFDDLLPYYNSELRFMRELAKEFAAANPRIAAQLRLSADTVEDPHVGRLIEAFAFLNARTRMKLEDEFPELTESLLGLLYPHYLAPFPSMSVVQVIANEATGRMNLPGGATIITEPVDGEPLTYRTGYPVELWPVEVAAARLQGQPFVAPPNPLAPNAQAVLRLTLRCTSPELTFSELGLDRLRFFLHGEPRTVQILHELILGGALSVVLADTAADPEAVVLGADAVRPVGLTPDEILLPQPAAAEPGFALLREYFAFPEKFLFFDLQQLDAKTLLHAGRVMEVFIYLGHHDPALEPAVSADNFRLFCTPIVNLFPVKADPIRLDPGRYEHRVSPDARRETSLEVYSIDQVVISDRDGTELPYRPYFSLGERSGGRETVDRYWHAARRASPYAGGGDDVFLVVSDVDGASTADADHVASVQITATNRNAATRLPFGGGRPRLEAPGAVGVARVEALMAPTRPLRTRFGRSTLWRLVSHLSLNHLSVDGGKGGVGVLKELLTLYDTADGAATRAVIDRLSAVSTAPGTARAPSGGRIAFVGGVDVSLEFDDERLSGSGAFLLGCVLDAMLASFAAVNAFSRTTLRLKGERSAWRRWPARSGTRRLL